MSPICVPNLRIPTTAGTQIPHSRRPNRDRSGRGARRRTRRGCCRLRYLRSDPVHPLRYGKNTNRVSAAPEVREPAGNWTGRLFCSGLRAARAPHIPVCRRLPCVPPSSMQTCAPTWVATEARPSAASTHHNSRNERDCRGRHRNARRRSRPSSGHDLHGNTFPMEWAQGGQRLWSPTRHSKRLMNSQLRRLGDSPIAARGAACRPSA